MGTETGGEAVTSPPVSEKGEKKMTIQDVLDTTDEMKPNMMSKRLKMKYLTEIEQLIHDEIVMKHEHTAAQEEKPIYTVDTPGTTEMVVPDPYGMLYVYWLMTKIDMQNQEDGRYNVDRAHFENEYGTMSDWWTRKYMPVQAVREFVI